MIIAVLLLNAFVQRYDRILNWYRSVGLPFALRHGLFVVYVCTVLLINALTLTASRESTIFVDVLILVLTFVWHAVGFVLRRKIPETQPSVSVVAVAQRAFASRPASAPGH